VLRPQETKLVFRSLRVEERLNIDSFRINHWLRKTSGVFLSRTPQFFPQADPTHLLPSSEVGVLMGAEAGGQSCARQADLIRSSWAAQGSKINFQMKKPRLGRWRQGGHGVQTYNPGVQGSETVGGQPGQHVRPCLK
jgi:hypothetical protein